MLRTCLVALLIAPLAFAAPVPKELKKDDIGRMLGEWETVRADFNGRPYNKDWLTFTRESVNWKTNREAADSIWALKLDPTKSPKEFEMVLNGNIKYYGLYKFEGDTLILACKHNARPDGFTSDNGTYLHELKRVGDGK